MSDLLSALLAAYPPTHGHGASARDALVAKRRIHDLLQSVAAPLALEASDRLVGMLSADSPDCDSAAVYLSVRCLRLVARLIGGPQRLAAAGACQHLLARMRCRPLASSSSADVVTHKAIVRLLGKLLPACLPEVLASDELDCSALVDAIGCCPETAAGCSTIGGAATSEAAFNCLATMCRSPSGRQACVHAGFPTCLAGIIIAEAAALNTDDGGDHPDGGRQTLRLIGRRRRRLRRSLAAYQRLCADPWSRVRMPPDTGCHRALVACLQAAGGASSLRSAAIRCVLCFVYDRRGLAELVRCGLASAMLNVLEESRPGVDDDGGDVSETDLVESATILTVGGGVSPTVSSCCLSSLSAPSSSSSDNDEDGDSEEALYSSGHIADKEDDDEEVASLFSDIVAEEDVNNLTDEDEEEEEEEDDSGVPSAVVALTDSEAAALRCLAQIASDARLRPSLLEPAGTLRRLVDRVIARPHPRAWRLLRQLAECQFALEPLVSSGSVLALVRRFEPQYMYSLACGEAAGFNSKRLPRGCVELEQVLSQAAAVASSHFGLATFRSLLSLNRRQPDGAAASTAASRICLLSLPFVMLPRRSSSSSSSRPQQPLMPPSLGSAVCRVQRATGFVQRLFDLLRQGSQEDGDGGIAGLGLRRLLDFCLTQLGPGRRLSELVGSRLQLPTFVAGGLPATAATAADPSLAGLRRGDVARILLLTSSADDEADLAECQLARRAAMEPSDLVLHADVDPDGAGCSLLLPCHRSILAARSDYFRALLSGGFVESNAASVRVEAVDSSALNCLLHLAYGCADTGAPCPHLLAEGLRQVGDFLRLTACRRRFLLDLPADAEAALWRAAVPHVVASPGRMLAAAARHADWTMARLCLARLLCRGRLGRELADLLMLLTSSPRRHYPLPGDGGIGGGGGRVPALCDDGGRRLHDWLAGFCAAALEELP